MATATYQFAKNQSVFYMKDNVIHQNTIKTVDITINDSGSTIVYELENGAHVSEGALYSSAALLCTALQANIVNDNA